MGREAAEDSVYHTVDGRNPAPPGMDQLPTSTGFPDFFHQEYSSSFARVFACKLHHSSNHSMFQSQKSPNEFGPESSSLGTIEDELLSYSQEYSKLQGNLRRRW